MTRYRIIFQSSNIEAPEGRFDIGRSLECNLVLDDPSVSRVHATIIKQNSVLFLEDRGSRNGCKLNGQPVTGKVQLDDGDTISIGHQVLKIAAIREVKRDVSNTLGLTACSNCGQWISLEDDFCGACGTPKGVSAGRDTAQIDLPPSRTVADTAETLVHSGQMLAGLAQKALSKNKIEEAHKLILRLMENIAKSKESAKTTPESELALLANLLIDLAVASNEPTRINDLFVFFTGIQRLLPRQSVEQLYKVAKGVGYRTSTEMHQYLAILSNASHAYGPGEKFIFRRIEGLVGLCS